MCGLMVEWVGPVYCGRKVLVKRCFKIFDTDNHDWMSLAFTPSLAVYVVTCAKYVPSSTPRTVSLSLSVCLFLTFHSTSCRLVFVDNMLISFQVILGIVGDIVN